MSDSEENQSTEQKKKQKRMTPKQWGRAKAMWRSGEYTLQQLSETFGVRPESLSKRFKKEGVEKGEAAEKTMAEAQAQVAQEEMESVDVFSQRIKETKEKHYEWSSALAKMVMQEIAYARQNGQSVSTRYENIRTLEKAANVLGNVRQERWTILGLDKELDLGDEDLPELNIKEMTDEDVDQIKEERKNALLADQEQEWCAEEVSFEPGDETGKPDGVSSESEEDSDEDLLEDVVIEEGDEDE